MKAMQTGTILLTRHAEKPDDPLDPNLAPAGLQRAGRLASYIPDQFGTPAFVFASAISKHSRRPYETIEPLSKACGLPIDGSFADQDYAALADELATKSQYDGKLVLICWHHGNIPSLARALNAKSGEYPNPWDATVFNLILKFDFTAGMPEVEQIIEPF
jgi:broad specificity phosphatase PhoE